MKEITIKHLGYLLKEAKENNNPQPIIFLGAGASCSGGIPLAKGIAKEILEKYSKNPFIEELSDTEKTYAKLMDCLSPSERKALFKKYIDNAKINVTHIYLAQLIKEGFIDYVLTVNFDNLMLRALALYNIFPPTYDMAILKDLTTSTIEKKSVVYLHGQSHGLWLLNTPEEMKKVGSTVYSIFNSIKDRPWIFIGYSGEDPIFEYIKKLGRFDNGLYWITYLNEEPNQNVEQFLSDPNKNAFVIKGYDSDSFLLKLSNELDLPQPEIVDKPFTALQGMLEGIVDIDSKEYFIAVKERLESSKKQVAAAIQQFENKSLLSEQIINLIVSEKYDEKVVSDIENKVDKNSDEKSKELFAALFYNWGTNLGELAKTKAGKEAEELYQQSLEKYREATEIKPDFHEAFCNWGTNLGELAKTKAGKEAEELYQQAFEKLRKATEIKPDFHEAFYNWGNNLEELAKTKAGKEAEELYQQSLEKYRKATEIKPGFHEAFYNWGTNLGELAKTKAGKEAEELYQQSLEKYRKATEIKPDFHEAFYNWGTNLGELAMTKAGKEAEELYQQAFEKLRKATEIKPDKHEAFYNWGIGLRKLADTKAGKEAEELYQQAFEKLRKATEIKPDHSP